MQSNLTESEVAGGIVVVNVRGEVDIASADEFASRLSEAAGADAPLIVSFEHCPYIDSSGLRVLVRASNERGKRFALVVTPGTQTRRIFDITGLGYQMRVCDTVDEAVAALREDSAG